LKLAPLLADYLYTNKRLDLPGIGSFFMDPLVVQDTSHPVYAGVHFEKNPGIKDSPELISFISTQTGKMKALASADLFSHLNLIQQFLNIGKPFLLEGIGNLVKVKSGDFEFTSGQVMPDKVKEFSLKEISVTSSTEDSFTEYKDIFNPLKENTGLKRPVIVLLVIAGFGLTVWAGYTLSKRPGSKLRTAQTSSAAIENNIEHAPAKDTILNQKDSVIEPVPQPNISGNYKFVVEVADKERGLNRFGTLKSWGLNVQLETPDSLNYKLYFLLPASYSDTARIKDSLGNLYTPSWTKAYVER
jgi:hypothetical protein